MPILKMIVRPHDRALLALTLTQPLASQVSRGEVLTLYRAWSTDYRGDLLITASSYPARGGPLGAAICVVDFWDVKERLESFAWLLRNPRAVHALDVQGRLGLWEVSAELASALGLRVVPSGHGKK